MFLFLECSNKTHSHKIHIFYDNDRRIKKKSHPCIHIPAIVSATQKQIFVALELYLIIHTSGVKWQDWWLIVTGDRFEKKNPVSLNEFVRWLKRI